MGMNEASPDIYDERQPTHKIQKQLKKHQIKDLPILKIPIEYFLDDLEDHPNQHKNNKKECDEKEQYPALSLKDIH